MPKVFVLAETLVLLSLLLLWAGTSLSADGGLERNRQELEAIRQRIERTTEDLKEKQTAERTLAADLKTVERELGHSRKRLEDFAGQVQKLNGAVTAKEDEVGQAREMVGGLEKRVRQRLVVLYKNGEMGLVRALFDSQPPARRAEQYDFLARVVRRDRELLATYRRRVTELETALEQLATLRREQEELLGQVRLEREGLAETKQIKKKLLAKIRSDERTLSSLLEGLRQRAERLSALVQRLESDQSPEYTEVSGLFASQKGNLPWPARGALKVGFGTMRHPDLGTLFDSQGIEIAVAGEVPIAAVWPGRVIFASQFQGYGNLVIVDHGDNYYTLYAQGSKLNKKVGDRVAQGETVALSGFADGDSVYFEIRHRGKPLDPTDWLTAQ